MNIKRTTSPGSTLPTASRWCCSRRSCPKRARYIADKHEQVIFKVLPDATKPEIKAAVEAMFKVEVESVQILERQRQGQALRHVHRPAPQLEESLCVPEGRPGNQLRGGEPSDRRMHGPSQKVKPTSPGPAARWSRSSTRTCTRAGRSTR